MDAVTSSPRQHRQCGASSSIAREKGTAKRGGSWHRLQTDLTRIALDDVPAELIELDQALTRMRAQDPEKASLVELRFFAGLSMKQAAAVLGISLATAKRSWGFARSWLYDEMQRELGQSATDPGENPGHSRET